MTTILAHKAPGHPAPHGEVHEHGHSDEHAHSPHLAHHWDSLEQQFEAGKLGMWLFLATEVLLFGGLFCAYSVWRGNHPELFRFGASSLVNDILMQLEKQATGAYQSADYFSRD